MIMHETLRELAEFNRRIRNRVPLTDEERIRFLELSVEAETFINSIDNDYAVECLRERYLNGRTWNSIADDMGTQTDDAIRKYASRAVKKYS